MLIGIIISLICDTMAVLLKLIFFTIAVFQLAYGQCNSSRNVNLLEDSFGQVIDHHLESKLDNQTEVLKSNYENQTEFLDQILDTKQNEQREWIEENLNRRFNQMQNKFLQVLKQQKEEFEDTSQNNLRKSLEETLNRINQVQDTFVQVLESKLKQQKEEFEDTTQKLTKALEETRSKIRQMEDTFVQVLDGKLHEQKEHHDQRLRNQSEQFNGTTQSLKKDLKDNHLMLLNTVFSEIVTVEIFRVQYPQLYEQKENYLMLLNTVFGKDDVEMYSSHIKAIASNAINDDNDDCPTDWVKMMHTCIFLSPEIANFDNATKKCEEMDGQLYEPKTLFHNQLVYAIIEQKERTRQAFYIGIHDRYEEGS